MKNGRVKSEVKKDSTPCNVQYSLIHRRTSLLFTMAHDHPCPESSAHFIIIIIIIYPFFF